MKNCESLMMVERELASLFLVTFFREILGGLVRYALDSGTSSSDSEQRCNQMLM